MKMNRPTMDYISSLVAGKAKQKLAALEAKRDAVTEKENAARESAKAEVDKVLADASKKVEAIYRKNGITPMNWGNEVTAVKLVVSNDIRELRSKYAEEIRSANKEIEEFNSVVANKQTEVIARLSLGGTAADLDEIIGAIEF